MYTYSFEKLGVWQISRRLTVRIYEITKTFPADERFGLVSQMRRAAISVASNIAEGSTRTSVKDQAHFYQLSFGSLVELLNQLIIAKDLLFIEETLYHDTRLLVEETGNKINALRNSCLKKIS